MTGLTKVKNSLCRIRERIRYSAEPMEEVFAQWGIQCPVDQKDRVAWEEGLLVWSEEQGLSRDDGIILERFAAEFGLSDVEGAIRYCDEYRDIFEERLQQALGELHNKGRVWMALGTCGGLAAGLLLM